jgi:hypothetical protein
MGRESRGCKRRRRRNRPAQSPIRVSWFTVDRELWFHNSSWLNRYTDIFEASARTTNNRWILGKTGDPKKPPSETANEVYLTVDRKDASLVDADCESESLHKPPANAGSACRSLQMTCASSSRPIQSSLLLLLHRARCAMRVWMAAQHIYSI